MIFFLQNTHALNFTLKRIVYGNVLNIFQTVLKPKSVVCTLLSCLLRLRTPVCNTAI